MCLLLAPPLPDALFAGACNTYHCYKGGPEEPPEGQQSAGCPVYSHPAQLVDNRNCGEGRAACAVPCVLNAVAVLGAMVVSSRE